MIRKTDELIIAMLMLLFLIVTWTVLLIDKDIDAMQKTIDYLLTQQAVESGRISQVIADNADQDARLDAIEETNRIQDIRLQLHREELDSSAAMFTDLLGSLERLEDHLQSLPKNVLGVNVSDQDIRDIAALVYLEAGSQSYRCQKAIASVIFNRMIKYNMTAQQTIHQSGVFSPANRVSRTRPSASCLMAVREVLEEGTTLPRNVVAFRNGHYHSFGTAYCSIDGVYFSKVG